MSVLRELNARGIGIADFAVTPQMLCDLIALVDDGTLAQNTGKDVLAEMAETGRPAADIVEAKGLTQVSDAGELEAIVQTVLDDNPQAAADLLSGKKQAQGFLMGQVMRATKGQANPQVVIPLIQRLVREE